MKKNNKGFTLVELLAVLVILITILLIAIPSITSSVERNKEKMYNKKIDLIEVAAESYVNLYKNIINYSDFKNGSCGIGVNLLKDVGLLTDEDLLDSNNNKIYGYVWYNGTKYEFRGISENLDDVKDTESDCSFLG